MNTDRAAAPSTVFPAELQLLLSALRAKPRPQDQKRQLELLALLDVSRVLAAANKHRVAQLLWHNLRQLPANDLTQAFVDTLKPWYAANALRVLSNSRDQLLLQDAFAAQGIRSMALKGVTLARTLYGDPALRQQGDIDLMVDADHVLPAHAIVAARGFGDALRFDALDDGRRRWVMRQHKDVEFIRYQPSLQVVDLHWRLTRNPALFGHALDALWARGRDADIGPRTVRTLSTEDLLIYLCVHGCATVWYRAKWVADLAPLLETQNIDWTLLRERAEAGNAVKVLGIGLAIAERWLGVALPPEARFATDCVRSSDLRMVADALNSPDGWWPGGDERRPAGFVLRYWWYQLNLSADWRYKLAYLESRLISLDDVRRFRLPRSLFFLYAVVRPFTWLARAWGGARRHRPATH